ncbi:hypothetical protein [Burkholderia anthina]|uniref:hypothetical protein n=1 Tax=Burkholderia anthina TaxID=179879 RepID=UPI0037BEECD8
MSTRMYHGFGAFPLVTLAPEPETMALKAMQPAWMQRPGFAFAASPLYAPGATS